MLVLLLLQGIEAVLSLPLRRLGGADGGALATQGSRGWSLLGVIASRWGGSNAIQMMREEQRGGRSACSSPLRSGSRIKQQQKHHPLGDWHGLPLPSLPEIRLLPTDPPTHMSPASPYLASQGPTPWGHVMAYEGSTVEPGRTCSQLLCTPRRGRGCRSLLPGADGVALAHCQQAVALPRPPALPS